LAENSAIATKLGGRHANQNEHAALPNIIVRLSIGVKVMVALNVETDLDITDGVRGEIVEFFLDQRSTDFSQKEAGVELV
jgi:hypothetical protein